MSESLEELRAERAALKSAMRSGALSVRHGDKQINYRSIDEIQKALDSIDEDIAESEGKRRRRRVHYIDARRGY